MTRTIVEVPAQLRAVLAERLPPSGASAQALTARYREPATGRRIRSDADLRAYATTRFPATYAAAVAVLDEVATTPLTHLDVGSGLGATAAAAHERWPAARQTCVEPDRRAAAVGREIVTADWRETDVDRLPDGRWDLVTAGYVLTELPDPVRTAAALWERAETLVIVEPGSRRSYEILMRVRAELGHVVAPCPHERPCPLPDGDWCHFAQRLPRSAAHRAAKQADRSYEDEPFSYLVLSRTQRPQGLSRIIRRPEHRKGHTLLALCTEAGLAQTAATDKGRRDLLWGQTV